MFKLVISPQAQKELKRISKEHQRAIRIALSDLKQDPFVGKSLTRELTGKFSYRVSVYRIIYKISKQDRVVSILTTGHRSTIYQ